MYNNYKEIVNLDQNQMDTIKSYNNTANNFNDKIGSLKNYHNTYEFIVKLLKDNDNILDLACGPAQISKYIKNRINVNITGVDLSEEMIIIANKNIPDGKFIKDSIITFRENMEFDLIIIGFGIPYLNENQIIECIKNCEIMLKKKSNIYISFMEGYREGYEKTSVGGENKFYVYYHKKEKIIGILKENGIKIIMEYELDYKEMDGRITKDVILIGEKLVKSKTST
jgi:ubiquinone/menaquinone biosynthesis C-methylase UbiE